MTPQRAFLLVAAIVVLAGSAATTAHACACCTSTGQRYVGTEKLDGFRRDEIEQVRFGSEALLYLGEGDPGSAKGIVAPSTRYRLEVAKLKDRWVFALRNVAGRSGTLALSLPRSIEVFQVDPRRGEPEGGLGPTLYKEWRLTAPAAATGVFAPAAAAGHRITLILHGHGNSCASAADFTAWTLVVSGPAAAYHFYGSLVSP